ncbi:MAG: 1-acyl-sn-glycerol-3-phosphate acyltransferase [Synechococcales bacterium]|nr:1-acyl-sn-glycerol-3-phosphate acyltransferase [Synechococcales bacterium]
MASSLATRSSAEINSQISPWLMPVVYPLGCRVIIPSYFGTIQISGQEHLPTDGPVILAPTHRARWDALLVPFATGRRTTGRDLRFMVSANEMKGFQGWLIRRLGGFPVNPKQPAIASLRYGVEVLRDGEMMVIFPEGGIFRDRELHPLKQGLARLAIQAETAQPGLGVRVVPMDMRYADPRPGWGCDVEIRIGQPLQVADYLPCRSSGPGSPRNAKEAARKLTADLEGAIAQLGNYSAPQRTTPTAK